MKLQQYSNPYYEARKRWRTQPERTPEEIARDKVRADILDVCKFAEAWLPLLNNDVNNPERVRIFQVIDRVRQAMSRAGDGSL